MKFKLIAKFTLLILNSVNFAAERERDVPSRDDARAFAREMSAVCLKRCSKTKGPSDCFGACFGACREIAVIRYMQWLQRTFVSSCQLENGQRENPPQKKLKAEPTPEELQEEQFAMIAAAEALENDTVAACVERKMREFNRRLDS